MHLIKQSQRRSLNSVGLRLQLLRGDTTLAGLGLHDEFPEARDLLPDGVGLSFVKLVLILLERLLGVVDDRVRAVSSFNSVLAVLVGGLVTLGVVNHRLDLRVGETGTGGNGDRLVLVGGLVLGGDVDNGVGVDVECHLNLGNTAVCRGDSNKLEVTEKLVVADELTLTLEDLDLDGGLEVCSGGED